MARIIDRSRPAGLYFRVERQASDGLGRPRPAIYDRIVVVDPKVGEVDISALVRRWNVDGTMGQAHLLTLEVLAFEVESTPA